MSTLQFFSLYFMAAFYLFAGISHFLKPRFFLQIMPRWVPSPEFVNKLVGGIEILLGVALLFEGFRSHAAWGIILLLIAVFPANINHFQIARRKEKQVLATLIRLPIQGLLIYWSYTFI
ncbi:MAG: MauE/DoxX family redox-associated membrane protein [Reichenbachiella sp.]|uniref:DoxX family protein n=1 Tax=Reichenbachiella sp. TaxID=2184521 RepID=UPI003263928F